MTIDWRSKGFWLPDGTWDPSRQPGIFDGDFTWPLMVVRGDAVRANIATMAAYCARHGLDFAPHAKTTMAPGLLDAQMAAGAWGLTVATPNQALVLHKLGIPRVLIANQILDPTALGWLATASAAGWEVYFQVDSLEGVAAAAATGGPLRILVELGHANGRTGIRSLPALSEVGQAVAAAPGLTLAGVTGYEGQLSTVDDVDRFVATMVDGVRQLRAAGLLPDRPIVSAGGSAWFDRVVERFAALDDCQLILRSGASITHDDGFYREHTPFNRIDGGLAPALEIWAQVQSTPEPGLAIAGMGKRDAPIDEGLPVPIEIRRGDTTFPAGGLQVVKLNDHHTYLADPDASVTPGDLIRFGISHPCTAFDKWRHIPVVDNDHRVVDVLDTYF
ncbi:alanine racemase [Actinoplanes sp. NBRC 101535]|uniref:alanine racemase n=1 Tax=Actinoplanes sp. NBRC 101535 TaxID=3032196 RepID=UPI0024A03FC9|nr:alanine racemase [Actinoplanes sp. NBRC 101535]GLY07466.1 amino acid deaminase [Actinoplanes sp. NBRC 101535]